MPAQVFGNPAVVLQLNQAFRGSAPSNALYNNQLAAVESMGASEFANAFAEGYVPANPENADDFVPLSSSILENLNLVPPYVSVENAGQLSNALPLLLFAYQDNIGQVVLNLTNLLRNLEGDANWGLAARAFNNDQAAGLSYSSDPDNSGESTDQPDPEPASLVLTVGQDGITGTGGDDVFISNVVQNQLGMQVNTLGSGDILDGGAGVDTLMAKISAGVHASSSWTMPIQPETESIETVMLEAVNTVLPQDKDYNVVFVNAKDLVDVTEITSYRSDASLIIQNMTTKSSDGEIRPLSEMTVGMAYTGNDDHLWDESDYAVYFDQDYLNPERTVTRPSIDIQVMNEDAYDATNAAQPLVGVYLAKLEVTLNGVVYDLEQYIDEDVNGAGDEITTYGQLLSAVQAAIAELKADNPDDAALQTMTASLGGDFLADISPITGLRRVGTTVVISVDGRTDGADNSLTVKATDLVLDPTEGATVPNSNRYERAAATPPEVGQVLAINIDLEKVGLAGDGGSLTVGSMFKDGDNEWESQYAGKGIEQFNVTVYGGSDKPSSLSSLQSTNNNLRVVTITTDSAQTGSYADLEIGNGNTGPQYALKDVQIIDASTFLGDLSIEAGLTWEVTDKYLDLEDIQDNPAGDNVDFVYTGGAGDDSFDVEIDVANWEWAGSATREDLTFHMDGGAGDDSLTLSLVEVGGGVLGSDGQIGLADPLDPDFANWYDNQKLNANLSIDGGDGDDTIWTPGSGDVIIDAGTGNDTVYADNTGDTASWIFNTLTDFSVHNNLLDPESDANDRYAIYNGKLKVTFRGYEVTVALPSTNGYVTDLQVNQAIKNAINNDAVLSELLSAHDGPANTLVVHSDIDSYWTGSGFGHEEGELLIDLSRPASLTAGEVAQLASWYALPGSTVASLLAVMDNAIDDFEEKGDYDNEDGAKVSDGGDDDGLFSIHTSDNTITPGLGNDVVVLGTGANSNDTVVYQGYDNGRDTIVNFETNDSYGDVIIPGVGSEPTPESFTATFGNLTRADATPDATLTFLGTTIDLDSITLNSDVSPGIDVAYTVAQYAANFLADGWIVEWVTGTNQVNFTRDTTGNFDKDGGTTGDQDVVAADFVYADATGTVTITNYHDGTDGYVAATPASFVIDLNGSAAIADGTGNLDFDFSWDDDGVAGGTVNEIQITYLAGDGPLTLANKFVAALNATGDWNAETNDDGVIYAERATDGTYDVDANVIGLIMTDNATDENTDQIAQAVGNGLEILFLEVSEGSNQVGVITPDTLIKGGNGLDYLDFSSYDVTAVYVNGSLVAGVASTAGQDYITMTESATNAGEFLVREYREAGATDTLLGTIGTMDFGDFLEDDHFGTHFIAENFIL